MEAICLRRTKEQNILGLPRKIMKICPVDLSAEERELYDQMEVEAKTAVQDYISSGTVRSHYIAVLGIVLRLRQTCTHMDLCPKVHIATLPCSNKEGILQNYLLFTFMDYTVYLCTLKLCYYDEHLQAQANACRAVQQP